MLRNDRFRIRLLICLLWAGTGLVGRAHGQPPEGFEALFNGRDLTGWWAPIGDLASGGFRVRDGVIEVDGSNRSVPALYTRETYENFVLELDFRISRGGNSGVFLHAPLSGRQSRVGFELQILDDHGEKPDIHSTGAVYDVVAPKENASKPAGEWNHYRIEMDWPRLRVWLNGVEVQDLDLSSHEVLRFRFRDGYIALQNHGSDAVFRNIYLKKLPGKVQWRNLVPENTLQGWVVHGAASWQVENGVIRGSGGRGYLVTGDEFDGFELQGYVRRTDKPAGAIRYRWVSEVQPGYVAEMQARELERQNLLQFRRRQPWWVLPALFGEWTPFQLICHGQYAEFRLDGLVVATVRNHQTVGPGRIALECLGGPQPFEVRDLRLRLLAEEDLALGGRSSSSR
ncbi:MAG: DUF1080 domain-containing protein [candidate division KSB1 bacterium]|nr:DUF1080 domain-containing protein [candidate division KSB1 bacterium]